MEKLRENKDAVSPVVGVILLVGLAVIMISTVAVSVFAFSIPESAPQAMIVVREAKGGLPGGGIAGVTFKNNTIQLVHKGGDSLDIKNTKIIVTGTGRSHREFGSTYVPPAPNVGNVRVIYLNLTKYGKDSIYKTHNNFILQDGFWTAGEYLLLSGDDGGDSNDDESSVWVSVDGDGETSNNYGFKTREKIAITVMDALTNQVISTTFATVKPIN